VITKPPLSIAKEGAPAAAARKPGTPLHRAQLLHMKGETPHTMNLLQQIPLPLLADAANSMWHEAVVFGIGIVSFIIIMAYAVKGDFRRSPRTHQGRNHPPL
jgi:hypothetical protein